MSGWRAELPAWWAVVSARFACRVRASAARFNESLKAAPRRAWRGVQWRLWDRLDPYGRGMALRPQREPCAGMIIHEAGDLDPRFHCPEPKHSIPAKTPPATSWTPAEVQRRELPAGPARRKGAR